MRYRVTEILAEKTLATSGTELIDINLRDPVSALLFEYKNTRGSNTNAGHVADCLTRIELIDGSDVLFSLTGKQLHALSYFSLGQVPYTFLTNAIGVMEIITGIYPFGRTLWDSNLAFDPRRFRNPQLRIQFDGTKNDADSSAHTLRIVAYVFDEKAITPSGFLMTKELKSYVCGAEGSYEYTELPRDYALRKMLIMAYAADYQPWQVANEIRLSEDNDKRVPIDLKVSTHMKLNNSLLPKWSEVLYAVLGITAADFYWTPQFENVITGTSETAGAVISVEGQPMTSPKGLLASDAGNAILSVTGYNPHGIVPVDFGDQNDITDWYDVSKIGSLILRIKAGSAGANGRVSIVLQQYRTY